VNGTQCANTIIPSHSGECVSSHTSQLRMTFSMPSPVMETALANQ
jgi:hypothetical protein